MISIITITCREQTGFRAAADSLAKAAKNVPFEWLVVDEMLTPGNHGRAAELFGAVNRRFRYRHVRPTLSPVRAGGRPDPNRARNDGLSQSLGTYAVFLDDNMTISPGWLKHVWEAKCNDWGFRSTVVYAGKRVPQPISKHKWFSAKVNQCSGIFGAPVAEFEKVGGFDEIYAGEMGFEDIDCVLRLQSAGVRFKGTRGSWATHFPHAPLGCGGVALQNQQRYQQRLAETWGTKSKTPGGSK